MVIGGSNDSSNDRQQGYRVGLSPKGSGGTEPLHWLSREFVNPEFGSSPPFDFDSLVGRSFEATYQPA
jgi:hypothetical protein